MDKTPLQQLNEALSKAGGFVRLVNQDELSGFEFAKMRQTDFDKATLTGILDEWLLVMIKPNDALPTLPHLVGNLVGTTKLRVTSRVLELSLSQGYTRTQHEEIYQLGHQCHQEPDLSQVLAIATTIADWKRC